MSLSRQAQGISQAFGHGFPIATGTPSSVKARQIVDWSLEAPCALACRAPFLSGERSDARGTVPLWLEAIPPKWRKALTSRRAAVWQSAAMVKAGDAGCEGLVSDVTKGGH